MKITIKFERFRFSNDGKASERQEVFVEVERDVDTEQMEQKAYDKLFKLCPDWGKGLPVNELGIGWSTAFIR